MKIKGLDIQTHGNLSGLKIDPLDDRLHIVETGTHCEKDLSTQLQTIFFDVMNQQGKCLSMEQISRLHISIVDEDSVPLAGSSFYQQLDRRHAYQRWWISENITDQPEQDMEGKFPSIWKLISQHSGTIICGTASPKINSIIRSFTAILKSLQTHHRYSLSKQNTTEIDFQNSIAKGKRCLLKARISEVDLEIAELADQQTNLIVLLKRREHLMNRLAEPAPPSQQISESRLSQLLSKINQMDSSRLNLLNQKELLRQQLADIELDLQYCTPTRMLSGDDESETVRADYQRLCSYRDRILHDLERADRHHRETHSQWRQLQRSIDQCSNAEAIQSEHHRQQHKIESEIRRINDQIQSIERIDWLEGQRKQLMSQLNEDSGMEKIRHLLMAATQWFQLLSDCPEASLEVCEQRSEVEHLSLKDKQLFDVQINHQAETETTIEERHLANLALRLACVQILSDEIGCMPLIINMTPLLGCDGQQLAGTLKKYTETVGQLILLTSDLRMAHLLEAEGGTLTHIDPSRTLRESVDDVTTESSSEPQLTVPLDEVNRESAINLLAGFPADLARRLGDHGVLTVQCLIESTTDWLDGTIAKDSHDSNVLQEYKAICSLLCNDSKLSLFDARILAGAGIQCSEQLKDCQPLDLLTRTETFLLTPEGQECLTQGSTDEICRMLTWLAAVHLSSIAQAEPAKSDHSSLPFEPIEATNPSLINQEKDEPANGPARFDDHVDQDPLPMVDHADATKGSITRETTLVECPLVEPTLSFRLAELNCLTVGDLLESDPSYLADESGTPKLNPRSISLCQDQIRLVFHVPDLPAELARLLAISGYHSPDAIAMAGHETIEASIKQYLMSNRGKRQFRGTSPPTREQLERWVDSCRNPIQRSAA